MINTPLVSVCVITYNSSQFVLETLESIKRQTYNNIELIISDDCSVDSTIKQCEQWILLNSSRFVNTQIIVSSNNTGIAPNLNRAYQAVTGSWVKGVAGDDILLDNCIQDNVDFICSMPAADIVFSDLQPFRGNYNEKELLDCFVSPFKFFKLSKKQQFESLLKANYLPAPTAFIKFETLQLVGYANERYPFIEDYPLWIKFLKAGIVFHFIPQKTVLYRFEDSITRNNNRFIHPKYLESLELFYKEELLRMYPFKLCFHKIHLLLSVLKMKVAIRIFDNKKTYFARILLSLINVIDPYFFYLKLVKHK